MDFFVKNLSWCFGYNRQIGLVNLCVNESKKMFLASSHIGIVYDFDKNEQKLLQGHVNYLFQKKSKNCKLS